MKDGRKGGGGGGELWSPGDWKKEGKNRSGVEPGAGRAAFHAARKMQHRGLRRK